MASAVHEIIMCIHMPNVGGIFGTKYSRIGQCGFRVSNSII